MKRAFLTLTLASVLSTGQALAEDVRIEAGDGHSLAATLELVDGTAPGVVMYHQCNMDRQSWAPLAVALKEAGIHSVAPDLRGFGGSKLPGQGDAGPPFDEVSPHFLDDSRSVLAWFKSQPDVDGDHIAIIGASCGGGIGLAIALYDGDISAVTLLSPSTSTRWLNEDWPAALSQSNIPIMGIASDGDTAAFESIMTAYGATESLNSKAILFKGDLHGVPLLHMSPRLVGDIVAWVRLKLAEH